jgi:quinol monooxygenase YgiN
MQAMKRYKNLSLALFGLLLALFSLGPFSFASTQQSPVDPSGSIHVIGRMSVTLDQVERAEFNRLTHILFEKTTQLDRPTLYSCNEDINSSGTFVWDEIWSSKAELDKHLASDHFKSWWSWVEPHLSGALQVLYVDQAELKKV